MKYPPRVQEIINGVFHLYEDLAHGTDDQRRELTGYIAQQLAFELGPAWGTKRADPGRPLAKDAIAFMGQDQLHIWDWQNGSTRQPNQFPDEVPLDESKAQVFVPVPPKQIWSDGATKPPAPAQPVCNFQPLDLSTLEAKLDTLIACVEALDKSVAAATQAMSEDFAALKIPTRAEGSFFGAKVVLKLT